VTTHASKWQSPCPRRQRGNIKAGDFIAAYKPIRYVIEGVLPSGFLYGVTARRGGGKTAFLIAAALAVIKGEQTILGREVKRGRVAYIVKENPDDFRMKLAANCYFHSVDRNWASRSVYQPRPASAPRPTCPFTRTSGACLQRLKRSASGLSFPF
jgi:AAA domain